MDIMLNDETINELVEQLKIYNMQREAENVSDIYHTLEQLDNTLNDMAEKISETQKQLRALHLRKKIIRYIRQQMVRLDKQEYITLIKNLLSKMY